MKHLNEIWEIFLCYLFSPDVALPPVSAYDNEDQMLTFVKSQLKEIAKRKGNLKVIECLVTVLLNCHDVLYNDLIDISTLFVIRV